MKKRYLLIILLSLCTALQVCAQVDRHDVRAGNRKYRKGDYKEAEIDYRKAVVKDSMSVAGQYNLASDLYRQQDYEGATKALDAIKDVAMSADYYYNRGDVALQKQDYAGAVEAFKQALLLTPGDMDAKENYIYAKKKLEDQQNDDNGGGDGGDDNQDQNQDQQQDQNKDQNQDQNKDNGGQDSQPQDGEGQSQPQPQQSQISPQQAQQMLQAIQAKEKDTQDKVNKEKAAALQSRQKEKNW